MKKTFLSLLITLFILSFSCFAFAQPMEEEEPIQTRPSPIMQQKMNTKTTQTEKCTVMQQKNYRIKPKLKLHNLRVKCRYLPSSSLIPQNNR